MLYLNEQNKKRYIDIIERRAWKGSETPLIPYPDNHLTPFQHKEIFVTFPCGNCAEQIVVEDFLMPGDIFVIDCENCQTSWSIYNPSLVIKQTKDLPDALKTAVAQNMAQLNA